MRFWGWEVQNQKLTIIMIYWLCVFIMLYTLFYTLHNYFNIKELLRDIWSLSDCNRIRTQNHLANWLSVRLQTKWSCVPIPLQSRWFTFLLKMYLQKDDLTYIQNKSLFVDAIIRQQNLRPACKESDSACTACKN